MDDEMDDNQEHLDPAEETIGGEKRGISEGREETDGGFLQNLLEGQIEQGSLYGAEFWSGTRAPLEVDGDIQICRGDLRSVETVRELLQLLDHPKANPNSVETGEAVIHFYVSRHKKDLVLALLLNTECSTESSRRLNIDVTNGKDGNTPLHLAAEMNDEGLVKLLIAFGAKANIPNKDKCLPVDLARRASRVYKLLRELAPLATTPLCPSRRLKEPTARGRDRMLFLDGGGMKGLVEIEILMEIERRTGRRITELFDWIVGTSIGGIIALALVYGYKRLETIRQTLLKNREEVFGSLKIESRTEKMEQVLIEMFGKKTRMNSRTPPEYPRVMVLALYKETDDFKSHFFNNCFNNGQFSTEFVWKVARYACAAPPIYFTEMDNYIDGGFRANNPCQVAWSEIHRHPEVELNPSLIVSVGTGVPTEKPLGKISLSEIIMKLVTDRTLLFAPLIGNAEEAAEHFKVERVRDKTPYFRFSPPEIDVGPMETNIHTLVDMIVQTKKYLCKQEQVSAMQEIAETLVT